MASCEAEEPGGEIVKHFTEVFHDSENLQSTAELNAMAQGIVVNRSTLSRTRKFWRPLGLGKLAKQWGSLWN